MKAFVSPVVGFDEVDGINISVYFVQPHVSSTLIGIYLGYGTDIVDYTLAEFNSLILSKILDISNANNFGLTESDIVWHYPNTVELA